MNITVLLTAARKPSVAQEVPRDLQIATVLPRDAISAILEPHFLSSEQADAKLWSANQVIGISIDGEHRAYRIGFLSRRETINDVFCGTPIAVTWSPLCLASMVYARTIRGQDLTVDVSGKPILNALVM